ncbi:MAG: RrF2 family transcriptional regulator [Faecalispora jeddahensis]
MKISTKGRYALAAAIHMARYYRCGEYITVSSIAENLGISKIYLEQVFSMLKQAGIIFSVKGAQGGYQLARAPVQITALDILACVELSLFKNTQETVAQRAPDIEKALRASAFDLLDQVVRGTLSEITLADLATEVEKNESEHTIMFYI